MADVAAPDAATRLVVTVLREALDAERARSDARLVALAEILAVLRPGALDPAAALGRVEEIAEACMPDRERAA